MGDSDVYIDSYQSDDYGRRDGTFTEVFSDSDSEDEDLISVGESSDSDLDDSFETIGGSKPNERRKEYLEMIRHNRRIIAVKKNNVHALKRLADTTEWYKFIQPRTGRTLLHIAIKNCCHDGGEDVFKYLLSLPNFPLDHKNSKGKTVLDMCFCRKNFKIYDKITYQLIKRGASVDRLAVKDNTVPLLCAIKSYYFRTAKLLMDMGQDVNAHEKGRTPLWVLMTSPPLMTSAKVAYELVTALLCHGADPTLGRAFGYILFEYAVLRLPCIFRNVFYCFMMDVHFSMDVHLEVLLILAKRGSPLFETILKCTKNVILGDHSLIYYPYLFHIDLTSLRQLLKKCLDVIRQLLVTAASKYYITSIHLENLSLLLSSKLRDETLGFLYGCNDEVISDILMGRSKDATASLLFYVLSYGLKLNKTHLVTCYEKFGFDSHLKVLLHMDIEPYNSEVRINFICPLFRFLYDVQYDVEQLLADLDRYPTNVDKLLPYFAHAKLRKVCRGDNRAEVAALIASQPVVPTLVELARNDFRKFFVKTFSINNAKEFRLLLQKLPILPVYKKIITLETKLYQVSS